MSTASRHETQFSTPSDLEVQITRTFDASRSQVYAAFTEPEHVRNWMLGPDGWTMPVCEMDVRPGGSWHYVWRRANGSEMEMRGTYREVVPPARIVTTESWGADWPETVNTVVLTESGERTTVTTTILYPGKAARDAALGTGMKDGAAQSYDRLETYLASAG
jgi:uncharacterized protein YndB with AHSA1/START domain